MIEPSSRHNVITEKRGLEIKNQGAFGDDLEPLCLRHQLPRAATIPQIAAMRRGMAVGGSNNRCSINPNRGVIKIKLLQKITF